MVVVEHGISTAVGDLLPAQVGRLFVPARCFQGSGLDGGNMVVTRLFRGCLHFSQKLSNGFLIAAGDGGMAVIGPVMGKPRINPGGSPEKIQGFRVLAAIKPPSALAEKTHGPRFVRADLEQVFQDDADFFILTGGKVAIIHPPQGLYGLFRATAEQDGGDLRHPFALAALL